MNKRVKNIVSTIVFFAIILGTLVLCIAVPDEEYSKAERRELASFPETAKENVISGQFSKEFESYTTDNFPFRDTFRSIKSFISYNILNKKDNNGLFLAEGHISKIDAVQNDEMLNHASERFNYVYNKYLSKNKVYFSVVPDKNFVLAEKNGYPSLDYKKFISDINSRLNFKYIDITDLLQSDDYYKTDTHWRQEKITDIADRLADAMGTKLYHNYTENTLDKPFYGVYSGQFAGKTTPDTVKYLTNDTINNAIVLYEDGMSQGKTDIGIYDMKKARGDDPYEMFLSGTMPLVTIKNPDSDTNRELILFRDSYGSSIAPLFLSGYSKITVIDIRYIKSDYLGHFVEFNPDADVLFLYSTALLNNSLAMQ